MGNKQRKAIKRQRKRADETKRLHLQKHLQLRLKSYDKLTPKTVEALRLEPLSIITTVLETHKRNHTLPPLLRNEFPPAHQFKIMSPPGKFAGDLQTELKWVTARTSINSHRLTAFLSLRRQFAVHFLLNETLSANKVLQKLESQFGASNWLIEAKLLTAEQCGGFEANRKALSDVLKSTLPHNVKLMAEFSSQRVDSTMSPTNYSKCINQFIADGDYASVHPSLPFYLRFTLAAQVEQMGKLDELSAAYLLFYDNSRPLIDQYCSVVKLLRHLMCSGQHLLLLDDACVKKLVGQLEPELCSVAACLGCADAYPMSPSIKEANELLWAGRFREVLTIAAFQIANDPLEFKWYELIARAALRIQAELPSCLPPKSPAQSLLEAVYKLLQYNEDTVESFTELVRASRSFDGLSIGYQIAGFCQRAVPHKVVEEEFGPIVYSSQFPPQNVASLSPTIKRSVCEYLETNGATLSIRLIESLSQLSHQQSPIPPTPVGIDEFRWAITVGDSLNAAGHYSEAVCAYRSVISNENSPVADLADATRGIVSSLTSLRRFDEIAEMIATTELEHLTLLLLVEVGRIVGHYVDSAHETAVSNLGWSVLFMLDYAFGNTKREDLFEVYANFMEASGSLRPSQIGLQAPPACGKAAYCFFLRWVCQPQVMDSDVEFLGQTDVEAERVAICQILQVLDPDQKDAYATEISELQQSLAVRKAMKHVEESKIHYNVEGIEKTLGPSFVEQFQRFRALSNLGDFARAGIDLQWAKSEGVHPLSQDSAFSAFRQLFIDVRSAFLFSNEHGLDSYLSVRVRHETMKGTLRSVFERFNLITTTNEGVYQENVSWNTYLTIGEENERDVHEIFANFSRNVDGIIALVSNQWIRIKDLQKQKDGLFDFDYSTDQLIDIYHETKDCEDVYEFLDELFSRLRDRLLDRLVAVRGVIETVLHELFLQRLDELTSSIERIHSTVPAPLAAAITHSRTEIQKTVVEISNWFTLHDSPQLESITLTTLITAVVESIGKCSPTAPFECDVIYIQGDDLVLKGDVFVPLWDGIFLVFRNVVRHAGANCAKTKLTINIADESLELEIRNPLGDTQSEADVKTRLQAILSQPPEIVRREEGSGLRKLQKLLRDDLKVATNHLEFYVSDGEFVTKLKLGLCGVRAC